MRKSLILLTLLLMPCSFANAQSLGGSLLEAPPPVLVELVGTDSIAPVGSNDAAADFKIEFTARSNKASVCFDKSPRKGDFAIANENGSEALLAGSTISASIIVFGGSSPGDTATQFCLAKGVKRGFALLVRLENPGEPGFYKLRMVGLSDLAVRLLPSGAVFVTDSIFVNDEDIPN